MNAVLVFWLACVSVSVASIGGGISLIATSRGCSGLFIAGLIMLIVGFGGALTCLYFLYKERRKYIARHTTNVRIVPPNG